MSTQRDPGRRSPRRPPPYPPQPGWRKWVTPIGLVAVMALAYFGPMLNGPTPAPLTYTSLSPR